MIEKITIIGLGLIGGSLGLAIRKKEEQIIVAGIPRRAETIDQALKIGAITKGTLSLADGVRDADVVFICTPISLIVPTLVEILPHLKKGAIVSDVGSTKAAMMATIEKLDLKGIHFFGGHPMAGKEKTGILEADATLFENKPYVLVKPKNSNAKALAILINLLKKIGGNIMEVDAKNHDLAVAAISHFPIMVASSLVNAVSGLGPVSGLATQLASTGFGDTTRIASGDPRLGLEIFRTNQAAILNVLAAFKQEIADFENAIKAGDEVQIINKLSAAKKFRDDIYR